MTDREKVIKELEEVQHYINVENLPAHTLKAKLVIDDAIALLKAQEPRVLSVADIIDAHITPDIIWIERRRENDICVGVWQIDHYEMAQDGVIDDLGEEIAEMPDAYNTLWRCWTSRPTDEQRAAVKWE